MATIHFLTDSGIIQNAIAEGLEKYTINGQTKFTTLQWLEDVEDYRGRLMAFYGNDTKVEITYTITRTEEVRQLFEEERD